MQYFLGEKLSILVFCERYITNSEKHVVNNYLEQWKNTIFTVSIAWQVPDTI